MSDKVVLWVLVSWISIDLVHTILRLILAIMEHEAGKAVFLTLSIFGALIVVTHVIDMARSPK